jgi:hypothetical protein
MWDTCEETFQNALEVIMEGDELQPMIMLFHDNRFVSYATIANSMDYHRARNMVDDMIKANSIAFIMALIPVSAYSFDIFMENGIMRKVKQYRIDPDTYMVDQVSNLVQVQQIPDLYAAFTGLITPCLPCLN